MMRVGSLFAGIGGLDLGAERAGFEVAWQCEVDDYCRDVLNNHWPHTPTYSDVRSLYRAPYRDSRWPPPVEILCGGFPCQDISLAGHGDGLNGQRSGLWWEFARIIRRVRPQYLVVENVPALTFRGLNAILGWLATHGYDAEWQIVSAAAMGAPHIRERLFVVAYPASERSREKRGFRRPRETKRSASGGETNAETLSDPDGSRWGAQQRGVSKGKSDTAGKLEPLANSDGAGCEEQHTPSKPAGTRHRTGSDDQADVADAAAERCDSRPGLRSVFSGGERRGRLYHRCLQRGRQKWQSEPEVGRLADGVPDRVDRLRGLGNAVVSQVAEFVFTCIGDHADPCP